MKSSILMSALLLVCTASFVTTANAQWWGGGERVKGSGTIVSENRTTESFSGVHLSGSGNVYVTQGSPLSLRIEADDNVIKKVRTEVKNGVLGVEMENGSYNNVTLKVHVTMPEVHKLTVSGSGDIVGKTPITTNDLYTSISGSGNIKLAGKATVHDARISGSGSLSCFDLESENATIKVSGSGDCEVNATKQLKVSISGSGDVAYKGNPSISQSVSGSGSVRRR